MRKQKKQKMGQVYNILKLTRYIITKNINRIILQFKDRNCPTQFRKRERFLFT